MWIMIKNFKIFIFLFTILFTSNVNAKPIPPGAGDGDVAANILFLVDSSASMGRWIGSDGLGRVRGVSYDLMVIFLLDKMQEGRRSGVEIYISRSKRYFIHANKKNSKSRMCSAYRSKKKYYESEI